MKKLVGLALYGITLFGISAGLGWYLQQKALDDAAQLAAEEQQAAREAAALEATERTKIKPVDAFGDPISPEVPDTDQQMPVAVRPKPMTVEEIVRYGLGLKERDQKIQEREEALQAQARRQKLVMVDIEGVQKEIEGLLIQSRDQREAAEKLLKQVYAEKQQLEAEKKQKETEQPEVKGSASAEAELPNLKAGSEIFAGLEPEAAAAILTDFANSGRMEEVVQYLIQMDSRKQVEVIQAIEDKNLQGEIIRGVSAVMPKTRTATRR